MQTRCHLCGKVIDATDAVRREMEVGRSEGSGSAYSMGHGHGNLASFSTSHSGGQRFYGMVDLCQRCDDREERLQKKADNEAKLRRKENTIVAVVALSAFAILVLAIIIGMLLSLPN